MNERLSTTPMRGLMRTSAVSGSAFTHLGLPYYLNKDQSSGLYPNLTNFETEGTLSNYRKWGFN